MAFRIEFRQRFRPDWDGGWGRWEDLDLEDYDSVEDAREEIESERKMDATVSSGLWSYQYRIVEIIGVVGRSVIESDEDREEMEEEDSEVPVALSEGLIGNGNVSVPKERLEALEGIEARLEAEWQGLQAARERTADAMVRGMVSDVPNLEAIKVAEDWLSELTGRQKLLNKIMGKD